MSGFESARAGIDEKFNDSSSSSPDENRIDQSSDQASQRDGQEGPGSPGKTEVAQAIADLEKMDKFKLDGQEWTLKDLKAAIMRQKDYTQKTQSLSEARKSFDGERKFYENLHYDLKNVAKNPDLVSQFLRIYPEKFHSYLNEVLGGQEESQSKGQPQQQESRGLQIPVELMSKVERLDKFYQEQEVSKNEAEINRHRETFLKKYNEADEEKVLARTYEAYMIAKEDAEKAGVPLNFSVQETLEQFFKQSHDQEQAKFVAKQKEFQKKQMEANSKAKGVGAGGGTASQAPKKFSKLSEVTDYAVKELTGRG